MTAEDLKEASSGRAGLGSRQRVCRAVPSWRRHAHQTSSPESRGLGIHARRPIGNATMARAISNPDCLRENSLPVPRMESVTNFSNISNMGFSLLGCTTTTGPIRGSIALAKLPCRPSWILGSSLGIRFWIGRYRSLRPLLDDLVCQIKF